MSHYIVQHVLCMCFSPEIAVWLQVSVPEWTYRRAAVNSYWFRIRTNSYTLLYLYICVLILAWVLAQPFLCTGKIKMLICLHRRPAWGRELLSIRQDEFRSDQISSEYVTTADNNSYNMLLAVCCDSGCHHEGRCAHSARLPALPAIPTWCLITLNMY